MARTHRNEKTKPRHSSSQRKRKRQEQSRIVEHISNILDIDDLVTDLDGYDLDEETVEQYDQLLDALDSSA